MKKTIIYSLAFLTLFKFSSTAYAISTTPIPTQQKRSEVRERVEEKKQLIYERQQLIRQRIEEKKASISARLDEARQNRVRFYWGRLRSRLESIVNRQNTLISRIESRVAKIKESDNSIDTTEVEEQIEVTKDTLDEIVVQIEMAEEDLENVFLSDNPKEAFQVLKDRIKEIRDNLIEVHRTLVHLIGDIKGLRVGQSSQPTATSSPTITQ